MFDVGVLRGPIPDVQPWPSRRAALFVDAEKVVNVSQIETYHPAIRGEGGV